MTACVVRVTFVMAATPPGWRLQVIARRCAVAGDRFFHHWQIRAYISNRAVVLKPSGNTGNDSAAIAVLPTEQYISAMKSTPSLMH